MNKTAASVNKKRKAVNVRGGSRDPNRGKWCTQLAVAKAIGRFDLDPFSNDRSHIEADADCQLERGDNGFGDGTAGSYLIAGVGLLRATADTRTFIQPDYRFVMKALNHYGHTRFCALLRFDPRPTWFKWLYRRAGMICVLAACEFEPPPGVPKGGGNSFPHALFYRDARDVTDAVLRRTYSWRLRSNGT